MTKSAQHFPLRHPARALLPPLEVLEQMGYAQQQCLRGTGVTASQLSDPGALITLQQELRFYRNVLEVSDDPLIGLRLGEPFVPQRYGLFGYALLSAETFRHALAVAEHFGRLTFSLFSFYFGVEGRSAWFALRDPPVMEPELINLYLDRDLAAARVDFTEILGKQFAIACLHLPHDGRGCVDRYRQYFACDLELNRPDARFHFSSEILDQPLPQSDPDSSRHLQQQCHMLIAKLTSQGSFVDQVRMLILARPGYFPDVDYVAEKMELSTRTLRRRLKNEGTSFRDLLEEIRYGLAREYLTDTDLPMEEISSLLGYTESGNFSHAFRRWAGLAPSAWRQQAAQARRVSP
ncbi:AraC family transcriptional regulator [Pseudohalioglobus sediminis]|uniref:AraC family transcriptional regulator n=1 Tax=Pseudohalioglobus sediminis TaxID=2606449 RepID=A0A5B0X1S8_9GAMM|nr:AraC family transcriptional regulator [Pseudohalioglobus sediminis]KAA1193324.1 AraC family transcriptional regulator [Pseudohalioglobus sediminis]